MAMAVIFISGQKKDEEDGLFDLETQWRFITSNSHKTALNFFRATTDVTF